MTKFVDNVKALSSHLELNKLELKNRITLGNDGRGFAQSSIIQIYDNEAVSSDEYFLYETYNVSEAVEFLMNNDYLIDNSKDHYQYN